MVQKRVKAGKEFEEYIYRVHGLSRHMKRPRLCWSGEGRNNMDKLSSLDKNVNKFKPILSESKFIKSDAIDEDGNLYEIKKYSKKQLKKYLIYSEPIIKVAPSRSKWGVGDPFYDTFKGAAEYNSFIENLLKTKWWNRYSGIILDSITHSNRGIYCKCGFIPHSQLTFRWVINKGEYGPIFDGYHRLCIIFKLKDNNKNDEPIKDFEFKKPKSSILEFIKSLIS